MRMGGRKERGRRGVSIEKRWPIIITPAAGHCKLPLCSPTNLSTGPMWQVRRWKTETDEEWKKKKKKSSSSAASVGCITASVPPVRPLPAAHTAHAREGAGWNLPHRRTTENASVFLLGPLSIRIDCRLDITRLCRGSSFDLDWSVARHCFTKNALSGRRRPRVLRDKTTKIYSSSRNPLERLSVRTSHPARVAVDPPTRTSSRRGADSFRKCSSFLVIGVRRRNRGVSAIVRQFTAAHCRSRPSAPVTEMIG